MNFEFDDLPLWDHLRMHLREGKATAIKQADLAAMCGVPVRAIQEALEAAKRRGEPVITSSGKPAGVWLSFDVAELRDAYRRDRNRAIRQLVNNRGRLKAISALERWADGVEVEQTRLPWDVAA